MSHIQQIDHSDNHNNLDIRGGLISEYYIKYRVNCNAITELLSMYAEIGNNTELKRQVGTIDYLCNEELELFWKEFNEKLSSHPHVHCLSQTDVDSEHIAQVWKSAFDEWFELSEDAWKRATQEFNEMIVEEYGDESEQAKEFQVGTFNGVVMPTHIDGRKVVSYPNAGMAKSEL